MRTSEHERTRPLDVERSERSAERQPPALDVLALQRSAGNRAVATMLARDAAPEKMDTSATGTATLTKVGVIPLLSFSMGGSPPLGKPQSEVSFTSKVGPHSDKLMKAFTAGTILDAEVVLTSGFKVKFLKAMIASYSTSSNEGEPIEHWTLAPTSIVIGDKEQAPDKGPDWDRDGERG